MDESTKQGEDQKKKRSSVQKFPQILIIVSKLVFHDFLSEDQKKKKKRSSSQKFYEIRCESTKITKIRAVNTNLRVSGLDLYSNGPEPVNFFGHSPRLGGTIFVWGGTSSHLGEHGPGMPPVAPGLVCCVKSTHSWDVTSNISSGQLWANLFPVINIQKDNFLRTKKA